MRILVCLAKVPDTTTKIVFTDDKKKLKSDGVQFIVNPYDEWYSLVRATEIKEKDPQTEVHLISVGSADYDAVIRKALAIGGDKAIRIDADAEDSFFTAKQIAEYVKTQQGYDLIFTGKETLEYNSGMVGAMVAELLSMLYFDGVSKLDLNADKVVINKEIEGGTQKIEASLPLVLCVQKGLAEQRIPNMKGIIASRTKPIEVIKPFDVKSKTPVESLELPPPKQSVKLVDPNNVGELVRLLHEEAKVI